LAKLAQTPRDVAVAAILDDAGMDGLEPECRLTRLYRHSWLDQLAENPPNLLLVEPASALRHGWILPPFRAEIGELEKLVDACHERGIPTTMWDRNALASAHSGRTTAPLVDHVFTTDIDEVAPYANLIGHGRVHLLPPAAVPDPQASHRPFIHRHSASPTAIDEEFLSAVMAGVPVVSRYSRGVRLIFGDLITMTDDPGDPATSQPDMDADSRRLAAQALALEQFSFESRLRVLMATVAGLEAPSLGAFEPYAAAARRALADREAPEWTCMVDPASMGPLDYRSDEGTRVVVTPTDKGAITAAVVKGDEASCHVAIPGSLSKAQVARGHQALVIHAGHKAVQGFGMGLRWEGTRRKGVGPWTTVRDHPETLWVPQQAKRLSIRYSAESGVAAVASPLVRPAFPGPKTLTGRPRVLLVTDHYPAYTDLYHYGFIHSRIRAYRELGVDVDIYLLRPWERYGCREFEGVEVASGGAHALRVALSEGHYQHILVHFLSRALWAVLRDFDGVPTTVWVHGAEIQPWSRRSFNYSTDEEREKAQAASRRRVRLWREVMGAARDNMSFVFVSHTFRDEVIEDLGREQITVDVARTQVIPNPVDTSLFTYVPKPPEQRLRLLSIRPYATAVYANDLMVSAILDLANEPWFSQLDIRVLGAGDLFDKTVAPLQAFPNVACRRTFLPQGRIAELYRDYGVMLIPSRADTQGVTRDEAMASGMVPLTSAVAAIPEFCSHKEGYLAPPEDFRAIADSVREMYAHPEIFEEKSRAAAERIRATISTDHVIPREIALFAQDSG